MPNFHAWLPLFGQGFIVKDESPVLFLFRKRSLPFLTVDATIGNQAFSHDGWLNIFLGLSYHNTTVLNSQFEAQVEFTFKIMERARVTSYWCNSYERQFARLCTEFFSVFWSSNAELSRNIDTRLCSWLSDASRLTEVCVCVWGGGGGGGGT